MKNGTAAAGVLATVIHGHAHQMRKVTHDNDGGNDIQLVRHFLNVNEPKE